MKPIILAFFAVLLFASCSNDSESEQRNFFNLKKGNLWVYKRYTSTDNVNYTFSDRIDSVRTTGDSLISGVSFVKLQHRVYDSGVFSEETIETLRVDENGHLVNQDNIVIHPGLDNEFQNIRPILVGETTNVGSMTEQLQSAFIVTVEGMTHLVFPYYGNFVSTSPSIPDNYIFYQYRYGLGLVCQHCATVSGSSFYEDRLVSYELN